MIGRERKGLYLSARRVGYTPPHAWHCAQTILAWRDEEDMELVKIECEPDSEPYDPGDSGGAYINQFGRRVSAEQARKELDELISRTGIWCIAGYYRVSINDEWICADSICGCAGYEDPVDWRENWYVPDIMQATLDELEKAQYAEQWGELAYNG